VLAGVLRVQNEWIAEETKPAWSARIGRFGPEMAIATFSIAKA
jgi:hypothetical protein